MSVGSLAPSDPRRRPYHPMVAVLIIVSVSLCITVDICQYAMPLPILPRVLKHDHSPAEIASVVGVYYWTGFLGCAMLTARQLQRMYVNAKAGRDHDELEGGADAGTRSLDIVEAESVARNRSHLMLLIVGLGVGALTLAVQAAYPIYSVHFGCRLVQGFMGSFLFFYSYLLAIELFAGEQQVMALTATSVALNVAEAFGPLAGSTLYTWAGESQRVVFACLAVASVVNQVMLWIAMGFVHGDAPPKSDEGEEGSEAVAGAAGAGSGDGYGAASAADEDADAAAQGVVDVTNASPEWRRQHSLQYVAKLFSHPDVMRTVILIGVSAVVKGSIEEIIPFFADHQWDYSVQQTGVIFSTIACGYVVSSSLVAAIWVSMEPYARRRDHIVACALVVLGLAALGMLLSYGASGRPESVSHAGTSGVTVFALCMLLYGFSMGFTQTPAALYLGAVVDKLRDDGSKDAANGGWNATWEAGGSVGFILAGSVGLKYSSEVSLVAVLAGCCGVTAVVLFWLASPERPPQCGRKHSPKVGNVADKLAV